jgi:hypothetical protein
LNQSGTEGAGHRQHQRAAEPSLATILEIENHLTPRTRIDSCRYDRDAVPAYDKAFQLPDLLSRKGLHTAAAQRAIRATATRAPNGSDQRQQGNEKSFGHHQEISAPEIGRLRQTASQREN